MGAFLHIGFVAEATKRIEPQESKEDLLKNAQLVYPDNTFEFFEKDERFIFKLRQEVIQEELVPFIQDVYNDFYGPDPYFGFNFPETLEFVEEIIKDSNWLQKVGEIDPSEFSRLWMEFDDYIPLEGRYTCFKTQIVCLGSEGKFSMEECEKTLRFMETCAQKAYSHYKLGKCIRVVIF